MLRLLIRFLLRVLYRFEISGLVLSGPRTLVVSNHQSFLDSILVWAYLPIEPLWLVHSTVARRWYYRLAMKQVRHLVLDTTSPFAVKTAVALLERDQPVIIFPEGRVTVTGSLMKVYEGPAFIAAKSQAEILPIQIDGAVYARFFSRMKGDFPLRLFPKIRLTIHPPRRIPMPEAANGKERRRLAGIAMRRILQEMLVESRPRTTLFPAFLDAVALHGRSRDMLEDFTGAELTYGRLLRGALALGRLVSRLAPEGEAVGVLMPNVAATYALLLGLIAFRRVPAMLNYTAGLDGMQSALRAAQVRVVLTSRAFVERFRLAPVLEKFAGVRIVYLEDLRAQLGLLDKLWLLFYATRFPRRAARPAREQDPAVVIFTSGSEGSPKGVVLSHASLLANIAQLRAVIEISPADKFMGAMPLFHSFGFLGGFLIPIMVGARVYIYPSPLHYRIIPEMAYDRDCTVMFATNTFLSHYARRAHPFDFRSVRYLLAGAEKLTDEVRRLYMDRFGMRVLEGYGATESSAAIAVNVPLAFRPGTLGEFLPHMEWKLEPVPGISEGGLLHVRGPNVMLGYWRDSAPGVLEPPSSIYGPGWYNTGDIATVDADGVVRLTGRVKRFAKVAGEMISLETVEKIAGAASPAALHASLARPDPARGEMIILVTQDAGLRREHLKEAAHALGAPDLALPRRILVVEKIPLLGNGKKDYMAVRHLVEDRIEAERAAAEV